MTDTEKGVCHIVGAGDFSPSLLKTQKGDLLIAADAGLIPLQKEGVTPDLYIGDCDSLGHSPEGVRSLVLPKVKDDTDTLAAARLGLSRGYRRFSFYGALGGKRFSHSLANLQTLVFLSEEGAKGTILDENCTVTLLSPGEYKMDLEGGFFSLFTMEGDAVISISGAKYPLEKSTVTPRFPLGVSNEGTKCTRITIHKGRVFFIREP